MLAVVAAPLQCQHGHDLSPEMGSLRNAVSLASQNASWVVGTLAVQVDPNTCGQLEFLVADAARVLVALLKSRSAQLASHAALVLGRCASRTELFGTVSPPLCSAIVDWLRAIAAMPRGADTRTNVPIYFRSLLSYVPPPQTISSDVSLSSAPSHRLASTHSPRKAPL